MSTKHRVSTMKDKYILTLSNIRPFLKKEGLSYSLSLNSLKICLTGKKVDLKHKQEINFFFNFNKIFKRLVVGFFLSIITRTVGLIDLQ